MNYIPPDDDDELVDANYPCGFTPGMPDPASADSFALWIHGLLEDPLDDPRANAEQDNDGSKEILDVDLAY